MINGYFNWLLSPSVSAGLRLVLPSVSAWLLNLRFPEQAAYGVWLLAPDVQQMGFTNITPGCTGFHSSSLSLGHSFLCHFSERSFLSCITFYFVVVLKTFVVFDLPLPSLYVKTLFCSETFAETGVRKKRERGFQCWIGWSLPPFLTVRQAPVFHLKRLWIYAANCSHLSSVNHLGVGRSGSPRPQADGWPAGEIEWKPAKPDAPEVLSRYHSEGERIGQQSNSECLYQRPTAPQLIQCKL